MKENIQNSKFRKVNIFTNKIEPLNTKPDYKPINKIEQHTLEPDYTPKNKISQPKLQSNYKTRNKIKPPKTKSAYKPINKIEQHTLEPDYTPKNKIKPPKFQSNYKTRKKIKQPQLKPDYLKKEEKSHVKNKLENKVKLRNSSELAEMIGIILGDGSIPNNKSHVRVILNKTEEEQYNKFVKNLMKKIFNKNPSIYKPKKADAVKLSIYGKKIVNSLIDKGLKPGDKKENQVSIPLWIKENRIYLKRCLRGLVDTDGSIHIHKHNKTLHISFNNASYPLVKGFKDMCKTLGIQSVKISPVKGKNTYTTGFEAKKDVTKFLAKVKPKKWEYRAETFGLVLKSISDPEKRVKIENELSKFYKDKRINYSLEYKDLLKELCIKHGYNVSNESLIKEIEKMLTYSDDYTGLTQNRKNVLNNYARKIIDDLKKRWK